MKKLLNLLWKLCFKTKINECEIDTIKVRNCKILKSSFYMDNKEKIDKTKVIIELVNKSLESKISYDEFQNMFLLLNDLSIIPKEEITKYITELGYNNSDQIFDAIKEYNIRTPSNRYKISSC